MKRVLLKTLQPAVVMMALCAAPIAFSQGDADFRTGCT